MTYNVSLKSLKFALKVYGNVSCPGVFLRPQVGLMLAQTPPIFAVLLCSKGKEKKEWSR
jgi:hypothetical protein